MPNQTEDIARLRVALTRIARMIDRQVQGDELSPTQQLVLGSLARVGPMAIGELAELEHLNPTMLSRIVGKLELAGLVRRRPDDVDGRVVRVELTEAGSQLQQRRRVERTRVFAAHIADLPDPATATLLAALPALEELGDHLAETARARRSSV